MTDELNVCNADFSPKIITKLAPKGWQSGTTGTGSDYPYPCPRGNSCPRVYPLLYDEQGTLPMPVAHRRHVPTGMPVYPSQTHSSTFQPQISTSRETLSQFKERVQLYQVQQYKHYKFINTRWWHLY
uniref:Uncharacterized protein n=2 Tax=Oryza TaxID=4527 RepID=Q2QV29_ORYSJ|nr:hypothetical protein LOC_Os12g14230 [Oryza sativa Japonica Group]